MLVSMLECISRKWESYDFQTGNCLPEELIHCNASGRALPMSNSVLTNGNCEVENELHKLGKNHFVLTLDRLVAAVRFLLSFTACFTRVKLHTRLGEREPLDSSGPPSPHPAFAKNNWRLGGLIAIGVFLLHPPCSNTEENE